MKVLGSRLADVSWCYIADASTVNALPTRGCNFFFFISNLRYRDVHVELLCPHIFVYCVLNYCALCWSFECCYAIMCVQLNVVRYNINVLLIKCLKLFYWAPNWISHVKPFIRNFSLFYFCALIWMARVISTSPHLIDICYFTELLIVWCMLLLCHWTPTWFLYVM